MTQATQSKQELLKQNIELTLIIIFIGLAFGLVGLVVPTAAVMSVVVISIGVIVGFVSYRDAFIPKIPAQTNQSGPVARENPFSSTPKLAPIPAPMTIPKSTPMTTPKPVPVLPTSAAAPKPEQRPASQPRPMEEALPRLPKIQRLPESGASSFPDRVNPSTAPTESPQVSRSQSTVEPLQAKNARPRKPRARKADEIQSLNEDKQA